MGLGRPATLQAPFAGPLGKSSIDLFQLNAGLFDDHPDRRGNAKLQIVVPEVIDNLPVIFIHGVGIFGLCQFLGQGPAPLIRFLDETILIQLDFNPAKTAFGIFFDLLSSFNRFSRLISALQVLRDKEWVQSSEYR